MGVTGCFAVPHEDGHVKIGGEGISKQNYFDWYKFTLFNFVDL